MLLFFTFGSQLQVPRLDTGKRARLKPKYWKACGTELSTMLRRLDSMAADVSISDREIVVIARKHVSDVHDRVIQDVMPQK